MRTSDSRYRKMDFNTVLRMVMGKQNQVSTMTFPKRVQNDSPYCSPHLPTRQPLLSPSPLSLPNPDLIPTSSPSSPSPVEGGWRGGGVRGGCGGVAVDIFAPYVPNTCGLSPKHASRYSLVGCANDSTLRHFCRNLFERFSTAFWFCRSANV